MSKSSLLAVVCCALCSVFVLACSETPPVEPAPTPYVIRSMEEVPPELMAVLDELPNIKTVHADITVESRGNRRLAGYIEFEAPDRLLVALNPEDLAFGSNFIVIGYEYFLRIGQDWFARPFDPLPTPDPQATLTPAPGFALRVVRGGTATVEGKKCDLYTFPVSPELQNDLASTATLQVCIADNRVQRVVWKGGFRTITAIIQYDIPVHIERPK